jgi:hypothetical protein
MPKWAVVTKLEMKMNIGKLVTGGLLAAAMLFPVLSAADGDLPDAMLSDWQVGKTVQGDEVKAGDLEGKVVVIEYWGVN